MNDEKQAALDSVLEMHRKKRVSDFELLSLTQSIHMMVLLGDILKELKAIREATQQANEPGSEDEPSPFQSLSG